MASNAALLYAESVVHMRTPQDVVEALANAYDAGALSKAGWQRDALKAQENVAHLLAANEALADQILRAPRSSSSTPHRIGRMGY